MVLGVNATAQNLQVTLILPPPSPNVTNLVDNPDLFKAIVTNTNNATVRFKTEGLLKLDGNEVGRLPKAKSDIKEVAPFATNTYNLDDIFSVAAAIEYDQNFIQTAIQTGFMPAGVYEWCFEMYNADLPEEPVIVPFICKSQFITTFQPPTILYPNDGISLGANNRPLMRWSPVIPAYTLGALTYKVQVFKLMEGQDAMQAFRTNQPFFERETPALQLMWPFEVPMEAGQYIWTVRAFNNEGKPVGEPETFAEPQTFTIPAGATTNVSNAIPLSAGQAILVKFFKKETPTEVAYEMIMPSKNADAVNRFFEWSDQYNAYNIQLEAQLTLGADAENIGLPFYDIFGNVIAISTNEGLVLTFKNRKNNQAEFGKGSAFEIMPPPVLKGGGRGNRPVRIYISSGTKLL